MREIFTLIGGILIAAAASLITAAMVRKRTEAETSHLDADSADVLSQAAARLIPLYDAWRQNLESRLAKAEETAGLALSREADCLARMNAMQGEINTLRTETIELRLQLEAVQSAQGEDAL